MNMATYIRVKNISCDKCEYYGSEKKFPTLDTPEGIEVIKKFGWDLSNPSDTGYIQTMYAGAICPECGNFSELDFDPDNNMLERIVKEPEPASR